MNRQTDRVWRWLPLVVGMLALAVVASAQEDKPLMTQKEGQKFPFVLTAAVRTTESPNVDGKLDEACWEQASVAGDFARLVGEGFTTEKTEAVVVWDDSHLYVGFRCFTSDMDAFKKSMAEQEPPGVGIDYVESWPRNNVEIFLIPPENPFLAKIFPAERYFQFVAGVQGGRWESRGLAALNMAMWNPAWTVEGSAHEDRWEVEMAIPWTALKSKPTDGSIWAINFNREGAGWALTGGTFHAPDHFGKIIFLDQWPDPGSNVIGPKVAARALRPLELDPLLDRAASLLKDAGAKLRALSPGTELRAITETLAAVDEAAAEAGTLQKALVALPPAAIVATWEPLKGRYEEFLQKAQMLAAKAGLYAGLSAAELSEPIPDFHTFMMPAITNERALPRRLPSHALPGRTMKLTACPGEYESGSCGIYALADLKGIRLAATDLKGPDGIVPASALDLRVVKVWYQAGRNIWFTDSRRLTPELLLKDDTLVQMDEARKVNILKMAKDAMRDADVLQPFDVAGGMVKQCWVTVHVPPGTKAGTYHGTIRITPAAGASAALPVELRVLPFELDDAKIISSIYYTSSLGAETGKSTGSAKTEEQLLAEFKDMRAHGLIHPNVYGFGPSKREDGTYDYTRGQRYLELRKQAGLDSGPLLMVGVGAASETEVLKDTIAMAKGYGYSDVYFMATDERAGDSLRAERPSLDQAHSAGGKVFVACFADAYQIVGDKLDLPIVMGLDPAMAEAFHAAGQLVGVYGNPQGGVEEPETYRRQYGLRLWKAGYDCACTFAYQGGSWDDYDNMLLRDLNMTYPTVNGVIPTLQWEGYREGQDDLRYLATLQNLIDKARLLDGEAGEKARAADLWVYRIDPDPDGTPLDDIRAGIIEHIIAIRQAIQ